MIFFFTNCSQKLALLPEVKNGEASGTITVIRENNFAASAFSVYFVLNDKTVTYLKENQYTDFKVPVGHYKAYLKSTGQFFVTTNSDPISFDILEDGNTYVYIAPQFSLVSTFNLKLMKEDEAKEYIQTTKTSHVSP